MHSEFCDTFSPLAEEQERLKNMHLETLEVIYKEFKDYQQYLKDTKPRSEFIAGLELSIQIIEGMINDKKKLETEK